MTTLHRKILRDLFEVKTRTLLVVVAIGLGIAAFSALLSTWAILTRELDVGFRATNPASGTFFVDGVDAELLRGLVARDDVEDAEARRSVTARVKVGPVEWRGAQLFVLHDFASVRIGKVVPQAGAWPPGRGEILLERDALQVARAAIGDALAIKTTNGSEQSLRVAGSVHDVGRAQARMENTVYGFVTEETLALLGERGGFDQILWVAATGRDDAAHLAQVAADAGAWIGSQGHAVKRVDLPPPGEHPHASIMGLLLLAQSCFGLFVLLLSGVVVFNLMTGIMAGRVRAIGVMQAIGGAPAAIARAHLMEALLLGGVAWLISVPVGFAGSRLLCGYMARLLNFDVHSHAVPIWVVLLEGAVGLIVPVLAAWVPVVRASRMPVRAALADHGVGRSTFGAGALDRLVAGIGGARRPFLLALRNAFRRRTRLLLTMGTLTIAGWFFLAALNVRATLVGTLDRLFATRKYDLTVQFGTMVPVADLERVAQATASVRRAENWITSSASLVAAPAAGSPPAPDATAAGAASAAPSVGRIITGHGGGPHSGGAAGVDSGLRVTIVAPPARTQLLELDLIEGRALAPDDVHVLVANSALAGRDPRVRVGSEIVLRMGPSELAWTVVGIAREPFSPPTAYVPLAFFEQAGHAGTANCMRLDLDSAPGSGSGAPIAAARAELDRNLEQADLHPLASLATSDGRYAFDQHFVMIFVFLLIVAAVIAAVGGLGLATTMLLNVLERRRELGVLRAIGATPRTLLAIVVGEGTLVAVLAGLLAVAIGWPISRLVTGTLVRALFHDRVQFVFEPWGAPAWCAISVAIGAGASLLPARRALRASVTEALAHE